MLTWVIVKARIDSSLNLYEHCVACDDENNCPAGPTLGGGPTLRGRLPRLPCVRLRCTPLVEVLKHLERRCTATFCLQRWLAQYARRLSTSTNVPQRQHKRCLAYFGGVLAVPRKKARFRPILTHLEAIFGLHLAARGPTGQLWTPKWGTPSCALRWPSLETKCGCTPLFEVFKHLDKRCTAQVEAW